MRVWQALGAGIAGLVLTASAGAQTPPPGVSKVDAAGNFRLRFHFQYFPSPEDLAAARAQVERARLQLCDATDGAVRITGVTASVGQASEVEGDVWLFDKSGRSYANLLGGHVSLYKEGATWTGGTLAHELGHQLLGLGDNYRERNRFWDSCGMGPGFDDGAVTPADNTIMQNAATVCTLPDGRSLGEIDPLWETACADPSHCAPCTACPDAPSAVLTCEPTQPLSSELSVASNFDSLAGSGSATCPSPRASTWLRVSAAFSGGRSDFPRLPSCGNGTTEPALGEQCDESDAATPLPLCTSFGLSPSSVNDRVGCADCKLRKQQCNAPAGLDLCGLTAGREQACAGPSPTGSIPPGLTCLDFGFSAAGGLGCSSCSLSLNACPAPTTCGDGVVQAPEECDLGAGNGMGQPVPGGDCARFFGPSATGELWCNPNCTFLKQCGVSCAGTQGFPDACTAAGGQVVPPRTCTDAGFGKGEASCYLCSLNLAGCGPGFDGSTWASARDHANTESGWLVAIDDRGDRHPFRLYPVRVTGERWDVHVLGQSEEYVGGAPGLPIAARTLHVEFDPATGMVARVASGFGPSVPGTTGTVTLGGVPSDGTGEGTPPFVAGPAGQAAPLTMTFDFAAVSRDFWLRYTDNPGVPTGGTRFFGETVVMAGPMGAELPIARCEEPSVCAELWNSQTGDWEGRTRAVGSTVRGAGEPPLQPANRCGFGLGVHCEVVGRYVRCHHRCGGGGKPTSAPA